MSSEAQLLNEIWEAVRDVLPAKARGDAALGIIRAMAVYGFEPVDLVSAADEDNDLTAAYNEVYGDDIEDIDVSGFDE